MRYVLVPKIRKICVRYDLVSNTDEMSPSLNYIRSHLAYFWHKDIPTYICNKIYLCARVHFEQRRISSICGPRSYLAYIWDKDISYVYLRHGHVSRIYSDQGHISRIFGSMIYISFLYLEQRHSSRIFGTWTY